VQEATIERAYRSELAEGEAVNRNPKNQFQRGHSFSRTHGAYKTPEYQVLRAMIQRCENPKHPEYVNYGGRGISVYPAWRNDFSAFFRYVGVRPSAAYSIERIDNNGNYEPGNVKWATSEEQNHNRRNNRWIEFEGRRMIASDWAKECGVKAHSMIERLKKFPLDIALTKGPIPNLGRFGARK
jgi:hypothetical protein